MTCNPLRKQINESTYEDVQNLVAKVTRDFATKYLIPYDDLIGTANRAFMTATDSYSREFNTTISSWVYLKVFRALQTHVRKELPHRMNHASFEEMEEAGVECISRCTQPNQFLFSFCDEISDAARAIVETIIDAKADISIECHWNKVRTPNRLLGVVQDHFEDLGWQKKEIREAVKEISEALSRAREKREAKRREKAAFLEAIEQTRELVERRAQLARAPRALQSVGLTSLEVSLALA